MTKDKLIVLLIAFLPIVVHAQDVKTVRDLGAWASLGVNYKFKKSWKLTFNQDLRMNDNISKVDKIISDLGIQYKINKAFSLGANVRYAHDRKKTQLFTDDIRYNIDFKFKHEFGEKFQMEYRFRYQHNYVNLSSYYHEFTQKTDTRHRIEAKYSFGKNTPFASAEIFREYEIYRRPYFNTLRLTLGDEFKTVLGVLEYSMNYERELNAKYPLNLFFVKIAYTFHFKHA
jgi:hypothetical protein